MITLTIPGRPPTYRRARSNGARRYHDKATTADRARIAAGKALHPLIIRPDGESESMAIVMPMRID